MRSAKTRHSASYAACGNPRPSAAKAPASSPVAHMTTSSSCSTPSPAWARAPVTRAANWGAATITVGSESSRMYASSGIARCVFTFTTTAPSHDAA